MNEASESEPSGFVLNNQRAQALNHPHRGLIIDASYVTQSSKVPSKCLRSASLDLGRVEKSSDARLLQCSNHDTSLIPQQLYATNEDVFTHQELQEHQHFYHERRQSHSLRHSRPNETPRFDVEAIHDSPSLNPNMVSERASSLLFTVPYSSPLQGGHDTIPKANGKHSRSYWFAPAPPRSAERSPKLPPNQHRQSLERSSTKNPRTSTGYRARTGSQSWLFSLKDDSGDHPSVPTLPELHSSTSTSTAGRSASIISSNAYWIALYFIGNLGLTLYNKIVLVKFPFPFVLTAVHTLCGFLGCSVLVANGVFVPTPLDTSQRLQFIAFSALYTINIVASNASLQMVSVPFHQVIRAATPVFTLIISYILLRSVPTLPTMLSLGPVVLGVGLATLGDYEFTSWGLTLTIVGTFLAALKGVVTNLLQRGWFDAALTKWLDGWSGGSVVKPLNLDLEKGQHARDSLSSLSPLLGGKTVGYGSGPFPASSRSSIENTNRHHPSSRHPWPCVKKPVHPLDLLYRMSPLAFFQCIICAALTGEMCAAWNSLCLSSQCASSDGEAMLSAARRTGQKDLAVLVCNGMLAFALNYVSFTANRKAGALSMTVAANVKQVLTILFAVILFDVKLTPLNLAGIVLTLIGGACYAAEEYRRKRALSSSVSSSSVVAAGGG